MREVISAFIIVFAITVGLISLGQAAADHRPRFEDEPGWSCAVDGNRVCGPNNSEGKTAGCYGTNGVLRQYWPCGRIEIQEG